MSEPRHFLDLIAHLAGAPIRQVTAEGIGEEAVSVVARLEDTGYNGIVSVELEDYRYHGSWEAQAEGLRRSQRHLAQFVR